MANLNKTVIQHVYTNFITNCFASKHPEFVDFFCEAEKAFLEETYLKVRRLNLETGRVIIWSGKKLYKYAEREGHILLLLSTLVLDEYWEVIAPTNWYDKLVLEQIVMSSVWEEWYNLIEMDDEECKVKELI